MTEQRAAADEARAAVDSGVDLDSLTGEILPALIARLRASRLAELEVRSDGWRVRLRRDLRGPRRGGRGHGAESPDGPLADLPMVAEAGSPAVGYFRPVAGLVVGRAVATGDVLGHVDVLGIDQDVTAPLEGLIAAILAETGQAVEYGQVLVEIDPLADAVATTGEPGGSRQPSVAAGVPDAGSVA